MALTKTSDTAALFPPGFHQRPRSGGLWVNVVPHLDPRYGGMSSAVPALGSAVTRSGSHDVAVAAFCSPDEQIPASVSAQVLPLGRQAWFNDAERRRDFSELVRRCNGVHIHGLWEHSTLVSAAAARRASKPYMISAHGMLQRWALNNKRWKKVLYAAIIERTNLKRAQCLHALTRAEAQDYRSYGLTNPIAIIPNGVNLPAVVSKAAFLDRFPQLRGKRLILFLSRVHFKKGVDILSKAWASVSKRWPNAHLVLAGPDFENTRASLESFFRHNSLSNSVTFTGMLDQPLKWSAFSAAECFILPSYSEGLSVSVLEALGMGLPVIISRECNLDAVKEQRCGWVIGANTHELETALDEYLSSSPSLTAVMSANGRKLATDCFSWETVGAQMSSVYQWLQGGPTPENVEMDLEKHR